jgi:TRAP-type mannitol/chloroaromatic compound transport system permease small subunit
VSRGATLVLAPAQTRTVMRTISRAFRVVDWCSETASKACYPLTLLISAVVLFEIVVRLTIRPTLWTFETTQFLFVICSLLPGALLLKQGTHVGVDIIYTHCSPRTMAILDIITFPFFLLFVSVLMYFSFAFAYESVSSLETTGSAWDPPVYPIKAILPIGATLLLLQGIVNFTRMIGREFFRTEL